MKLNQALEQLEAHEADEAGRPYYDRECYYCGGSHPSDCCMEAERNEFYSELA